MEEKVLQIIEALEQRYPDALCALHYEKDYELLFAAPADIEGLVDFPIYQIGEILPGDSLIWRCNGQTLDFDVMGFSHF